MINGKFELKVFQKVIKTPNQACHMQQIPTILPYTVLRLRHQITKKNVNWDESQRTIA